MRFMEDIYAPFVDYCPEFSLKFWKYNFFNFSCASSSLPARTQFLETKVAVGDGGRRMRI